MKKHNSRSPPQSKINRKLPIQTVSFLSIIFSIDRKKQYTRGLGSVAPHDFQQHNKIERNEEKHMELKFVVPTIAQTFGNLEFAGENEIVQRRINGRMTILSRSYNLYSDVQRADDVIVVLPAEAGEKHFQPEQKVKLINPRISAEGYKIGNRGFTNYILQADDMLPENK